MSLFHESFFDYLFARRFVIGQSLLELLMSTEQPQQLARQIGFRLCNLHSAIR